MKKLFALILALTSFAFILSGCSQSPTTTKTPEPVVVADEAEIDTLKTKAQTLADNLIKEDYSAITATFDDTMKAALNDDSLKKAWTDTIIKIGEYKNRVSTEHIYDKGYNIVTVQEAFENSALNIRVVFGTDKKVSGLNFNYAPLAPSSDAPDENAPYSENAVTVAGDETMLLDGILTLPKDIDNPPVVILVQGSGQSDKDETVYANRPFADIAHGLAKKGLATLRYDKRYFKYPQNAPTNITLEDEIINDVYAAINLMKADERIDSKKIYVLGHSLGGMLTPVIAANTPDLAGIISIAGSLRPLYEISYDQNQEAIKNLDRSTLTKEQTAALDLQIEQLEKDIVTLRGDISNIPDETILMGIPAGYHKSIKQNSGLEFIDKVKCPILVLQGSADFQVYPEADYKLWQEKLEGRDNVTFKLYPDLNHLMMKTNGKRDVSEYEIPSNVDQAVIDDIASFIK